MQSQAKAVIGEPAPAFKAHAVVDGSIKNVSLSAYTEANHWLILIFFPKAWSFICPTEIRSFSARLEEFLYSRHCAILFVSTDSEFCLRAWNNISELEGGLGGVHVPLVSDASHTMCKDYGVLLESEGVAQRALFVIDPQGMLRAMSVNDVDVGRSVDETQRLLDALMFKDEYGEGCPVDWKKGDKGIDIVSKSKVDGAIVLETRKSWTEWARPKLARAWSGTSQRSFAPPINVTTAPLSRAPSNEAAMMPTLANFATTPADQPRLLITRPALSSTNSNAKLDTQVDGPGQTCLEAERGENELAVLNNDRLVGAAF